MNGEWVAASVITYPRRRTGSPLITKKAMFKQFISKIPGADTYMVASFLIFAVFFALVGLYLIFADRKHLDHLSQLPLEDQ